MATFHQAGQRVGLQIHAEVIRTSDLKQHLRWMQLMIDGLEQGELTPRRVDIVRQYTRVYLQLSEALESGE